MKRLSVLLVSIMACIVSIPAQAELIVSASDGHQPPEPGQAPHRVPDTVTALDFTNATLKVLGSVAAPTSALGPPQSVYVAPNGKWALVTAGSKGDPADMTKTVPDDTISVIDLSTPAQPRIVQTLHAGAAVSSVTVNRAGTLALASNTNDDSVSIFTIAGNKLTPAGQLQLEKGIRPWCITFLRDGQGALLQTMSASGLLRLKVDGTTVTNTGPIGGGVRGTMVVTTADGKYAIVNGSAPPPSAPDAAAAPMPAAAGAAGGRGAAGPRGPAMISMVDLATGAVVATAPFGAGPEGVALSPDGNYLVTGITNGSHAAPGAPGANDFGLLRVYKVGAGSLTQLAESRTGRWCQGELVSKDNRTILVQCAVEREIEVFRFDGNSNLTQDVAATAKFDAAPASMTRAANP